MGCILESKALALEDLDGCFLWTEANNGRPKQQALDGSDALDSSEQLG